MADLTIPEGGFWPAPEIPQPNIYPMEWRVETQKLAAIYEKSKRTLWNPADLPWDELNPEDFTREQRLGIMYWFSVLANFDASGPAVFARLGELRRGDRIEVWRAGRRVSFRVTGTLRTRKDAFPTATVYGPTPGPELRLITCGGDFDRRSGHYRDNVVVFAVADPPADPIPRSAAG